MSKRTNLFVLFRTTLKLIFLLAISAILILGIVIYVYKPTYKVSFKGEYIGYTSNKNKLQKQINNYIENGDGEKNVAFVDIQVLPEYELCFLKKKYETNDEEIYNLVKNTGVLYYEYYAIVENDEEKLYVSTTEEAEDIINQLKTKKSSNINKIAYTQLYSTELKDFTSIENAVSKLYVKKKAVIAYTPITTRTATPNTVVSASDLGMTFKTPTYGIVSSRYGYRSRGNHTGIDIATSTGTSIQATSAGTVTYSGNAGNGYGNYVVISHGNGVQTLYAHCHTLYVSAGQSVAQGEVIACVGSTGNSTGPHLHFEIIINGNTVNPENYIF